MDVNATISAVLAEVLAVPEAAVACQDLRALPGIDSVKILRVITRIEQRLGIELDDQVVFKLRTLDDLRDVVRRQVEEDKAKQGGAA